MSDSTRFPVVGIGASAGGLEAFSELLKNLPNNTGMAYILVQHLDPNYKSKLAELLARVSSMPVYEIKDNMDVKKNKIYVIPPKNYLEIKNGVLKLILQKNLHEQDTIDRFLESLADDQQNYAIGIVLSGNGADGTKGLANIKLKGGITFSQVESTAKFPGMPHNANANGSVDFSYTLSMIAKELINISKRHTHGFLTRKSPDISNPDGRDLVKIFEIIKHNTNVDFTYYKHNTIRRRIHRRMGLNKITSLNSYAEFLEKSPTEVDSLYNDLLICVTHFFRDPQVFKYLKDHIFPKIVKNKEAHEFIRIWVPGCATGEEVYSLAISLLEYLGENINNYPIQIFGSDISDDAIQKARAGIYPENILTDVSNPRLAKYFIYLNGYYQINKTIRDMCIFAKQNVATDPPFSRLDLISCRNLLIYLEPILQKRVLPIFHFALNKNGYLMLGSSESIGENSNLFTSESKKYKIYTKIQSNKKLHFIFNDTDISIQKMKSVEKRKNKTLNELVSPVANLQKEADKVILQKYAPSGVVVNSNFEVLHFRGDISHYLTYPSGRASLNLLKMIREELFIDLSTALKTAKNENHPVHKRGLLIENNGKVFTINIHVNPLPSESIHDRLFLVLFENASESLTELDNNQETVSQLSKKDTITQVKKLKQELARTRGHLQATIEELELGNEKLQAANEEILSNNEELQSVNEELETSKEELQSTNEELTTVNEEVLTRNSEIALINNDLNNLITSVKLPIIMLDENLRIRMFTPLAEKEFYLDSISIGRPIGNFRQTLKVPNLEDLVYEVQNTGKTKEIEIQNKDGHWFLMRLLPYHTEKNKYSGIVMTFIDIEAIKKGHEANEKLAAIVASSDDAIVGKDLNARITSWNKGAQKLYGYTLEEVIGKSITLLAPREKISETEEIMKKIKRGEKVDRFETTRVHKNGTVLNVSVTISPIKGSNGKIIGASIIARDITSRIRTEYNLKFLSEASKAFSSSLDFKSTLTNIAQLAVPKFADWCSITLKTNNGLEQVAIAHVDPQKAKWARELSKKNPPNPNDKSGVPNVLRTGKSEIYPFITDKLLIESARNENELNILRKLRLKSVMIVPLRIKKETIGAMTLISDESGHHYTEDDLAIAEEVAERAAVAIENANLFTEIKKAVNLRDEFISIASHELKTPITSLKMYAQLLPKQLQKGDEQELIRFFTKMDDQINKLTSLIGDLLNVSKLQHGKLDFYMEDFNLNDIVKETVETISATSNRHKIIVKGNIDRKIYGDRYRIYQVLTNLLSNAIKYSPQGREVIMELSSKKDFAQVTVQDFGIGIDKENQKKIFNQFYRVSSPEEKTYPGLGIGLFISKQIILRHHGTMSVESAKGKGSIFKFALPYQSNAN